MTGTVRHPVLRVFFYGHFWLALGAMAQRWLMGELGFRTDLRGLLATGLSVVAGYGYLRLVRASENDPIPSEHIQWFRMHRKATIVLVALTALSAMVCVWGQFLVFGPWSLLIIPLLGLYLVPVRGRSGRSMGLREVPGIKVILVALAWTFVTCGLSTGAPADRGLQLAVPFAAMEFCFFAAIAIAFDIGDLRYDHASLRTIPQLTGPKGAKVLTVVLLIPWMTYWFMLSVFHGFGHVSTTLPLLGYVLTAVLITRSAIERPWWFFAILLDGSLFLVPVLFLIGRSL